MSATCAVGVVPHRSSPQNAIVSALSFAIIVIELPLLVIVVSIVSVPPGGAASSLEIATDSSSPQLAPVPDLAPHVSHLASDASAALSSALVVVVAVLVATLSVAS